jgi:membrane protein DedA with SNARE-associated domain
MNETLFAELYEQFIENIWLQGLLIALAVCFLEDAGRCASGLLVAAGRVNWWWALLWMLTGSMAGDIGLYLIGRYAIKFCVKWGWIKNATIGRFEEFFACHVIKALFLARFVAGVRTVIFMAAGVMHYRFLKFTAMLLLITLLQIVLFLAVTDLVGDSVADYLADPHWRWAIAAMAVLLIMTGHLMFRKRTREKIVQAVER